MVLVVDETEDIEDGGGEGAEAKLAWGEWICGGGDKDGCVVEGGADDVEPGCFLFWAPLNRLAASWFWGKGSSVSCMLFCVVLCESVCVDCALFRVARTGRGVGWRVGVSKGITHSERARARARERERRGRETEGDSDRLKQCK